MNKADLAKKICEDLGISWDEKLTTATLRGEPIGAKEVYRSFLRSAVFEFPKTPRQEYPIGNPKHPLVA